MLKIDENHGCVDFPHYFFKWECPSKKFPIFYAKDKRNHCATACLYVDTFVDSFIIFEATDILIFASLELRSYHSIPIKLL